MTSKSPEPVASQRASRRVQRAVIAPWLAALLGCLLVCIHSRLGADWLFHAGATEPTRVAVVSFTNDERGPQFIVDGGSGRAAYQSTEILWMQWREPDDIGEKTAGRVANMQLANGESFDHVTVESAFVRDGSLFFMIRPAGVPAGEQPRQVDAVRIARLMFAPVSIAALQAAATGVRGETGDDDDSMEDDPELLDFQYQDPFPKAPRTPPADEFEAFIEAREESLRGRDPAKSSVDPSNQSAFEALQFFGPAIGLKAISLTMLIGFFMGGLMLRFSAASIGISDVTMPRLMICAAMLATLPPFLFLFLFWIFPLFYGLKLFTGLAAFYFSARLLVMGFLEVLEGQATEILVIFYATWILLLIALAKLL